MPRIIWEDRYSGGVAAMDDPPHELNAFFRNLIDCAACHFSCEEEKMLATRYPGRAAHKQEHDTFIRRVVEMHTRHLNQEKMFFLEVLTFLQDWLIAHILQVDPGLGRFLTAAPQPTAEQRRNHGNS